MNDKLKRYMTDPYLIATVLLLMICSILATYLIAQSPPTAPLYRRPITPPQADKIRTILIEVIEERRAEIAADIVYIDSTGWTNVYIHDGWVDIATVWRPEAVAAEAHWAAKIAELSALIP